jgi:hypothetical protein
MFFQLMSCGFPEAEEREGQLDEGRNAMRKRIPELIRTLQRRRK